MVDMALSEKPPFLHAPLLPCGRAGATHQDVEHLATGGAQGRKLGQVEAVGQPHGTPAAAEERRETLGGAPPRAVWIEDAIDGERFRGFSDIAVGSGRQQPREDGAYPAGAVRCEPNRHARFVI